MSYWVFHNVKINKKEGTISLELIDMSVKDEYLGKPVKYEDFYQDGEDVKLTFEQKMASFIHDLLVGEYYINDFNSDYFKLNYENRVVSGRQDIDFIDNYGTEYSQMIREEMERQNTEERLKENEFCDILIKLNKKYEKEINNILEGKTVDGRELKEWQIKEQKKYLKGVFRKYISKIEIIEGDEEKEEMDSEEDIITIESMGDSLYNVHLDTEYREAFANTIMKLGYISDSPLNLSNGTSEQRDELRRVYSMPLDSNQISEIIHLMMYQMRDDFQFGNFKPIAYQYINIANQMKEEELKKEENKLKEQKPISNIHSAYGNMLKVICIASKTLKENNMFDESREMIERATLAYSYDEAFNIIEEYVDIVNERENEEEFE